jgi:predicted amidophosphoribosyltransferase
MAEAWAEQYEAWLDARADWLSEDEIADDECPMCGAQIDVDYRYCKACGDFV